MKGRLGTCGGRGDVASMAVVLVSLLIAVPASAAGGAVADGSSGTPGRSSRKAVGSVSSPPRGTQWEHPWGAILYWSFGSTWSIGASTDHMTPLEAEHAARERCGGGESCNVALQLNNECGAIAVLAQVAPVSHVDFEWAKAADEAGARATALRQCQVHEAERLDDSAACEIAAAVCSGPAYAAGAGPAGSPSTGQLPPEIELDRLLMRADQAMEDRDPQVARSVMERIAALQEEHGLEPAAEDHFLYAQGWRVAGEPRRAQAAVTTYLQLLGREAPNYREALRLLNEAETDASRSGAGPRPGAGAGSDPLGAVPVGPAGMELVWIPAGEFRMGSTSSEAYSGEQPVTQVRISEGFWLGKYEVTQAEWESVMGSNPSAFSGCGGRCPVEQVSWNDAQDFISRLNAREGREVYRLPTEAEWEYAARAGTTGDRYGDPDRIAWYRGNSRSETHPVGGKAPNAWGLHDMLGNVREWVGDWYGDYGSGSATDPRGPGSGSFRVSRGGSWRYGAGDVRAPYRYKVVPGYRYNALGFRLLRTR